MVLIGRDTKLTNLRGGHRQSLCHELPCHHCGTDKHFLRAESSRVQGRLRSHGLHCRAIKEIAFVHDLFRIVRLGSSLTAAQACKYFVHLTCAEIALPGRSEHHATGHWFFHVSIRTIVVLQECFNSFFFVTCPPVQGPMFMCAMHCMEKVIGIDAPVRFVLDARLGTEGWCFCFLICISPICIIAVNRDPLPGKASVLLIVALCILKEVYWAWPAALVIMSRFEDDSLAKCATNSSACTCSE